MKRGLPLIILGIILLCSMVFLKLSNSSYGCSNGLPFSKTIKTSLGSINTAVAKTEYEKARGLGGYSCIPKDQGMLFLYDQPSNVCMWMKDMNFPIDIVWMDGAGKIKKIEESIRPNTYPKTFCSEEKTSYVLELGSGQAKAFGLSVGSSLQL